MQEPQAREKSCDSGLVMFRIPEGPRRDRELTTLMARRSDTVGQHPLGSRDSQTPVATKIQSLTVSFVIRVSDTLIVLGLLFLGDQKNSRS